MKRLSVIIPVYNAEKHIMRCVNSILPQLTQDDELLLINDGSTDNTTVVLDELQNNYSVIRVIHKENEGTAKTRNRGIHEAEGEFICFVDNDDYLDGDYIDTYYNSIAGTEYDLVMGAYRRCTDHKIIFSLKATNSQWFQLMVVAPWAKIYRKSFLIDNKIEFLDYGIGEDIYFNFLVYSKTNKIKIIEYDGYNWWFNEDSISNTSQRGFQTQISIEYLLDQLIAITGDSKIYQYYYVRYIVWYLLFSGKNANKKEFMKEYYLGRKWLAEHKIPFRFPALSNMFSGEKLKNRMIVQIFVMMGRCKLVGCFARIYCKG